MSMMENMAQERVGNIYIPIAELARVMGVKKANLLNNSALKKYKTKIGGVASFIWQGFAPDNTKYKDMIDEAVKECYRFGGEIGVYPAKYLAERFGLSQKIFNVMIHQGRDLNPDFGRFERPDGRRLFIRLTDEALIQKINDPSYIFFKLTKSEVRRGVVAECEAIFNPYGSTLIGCWK